MRNAAAIALGLALPSRAFAMYPSYQLDLGFHVGWDFRDGLKFEGVGADVDGRVIGVDGAWDWSPAPAVGLYLRAQWNRAGFQSVLAGPRLGAAWVSCCGLNTHAVVVGTMLELGIRGGGDRPPWHVGAVLEGGTPFGIVGAEVRLSAEREFDLELSHPVLPIWVSGRAFRVAGAPRVATVSPVGGDLDPDVLGEVEGEWTSVFTFVRLARELRALGAPRALVNGALRAARDEANHARLCLSFARAPATVRLGTLPTTPRRFADREVALSTLAAEGRLDGLGNEADQAVRMRDASGCASTQWEAAARLGIARDERRHAALGGAVAGWCEAEAGEGRAA